MADERETKEAPATSRAAPASPDARAALFILLLIALLVAKRLAYHLTYLVGDPFALATFSDGQLYEEAARDILAHPPFGAQPFYLQGLFAYLLALPLALADQVVIGLLLQLVLAAGALWLFHRTAVAMFGAVAGGLSSAVLLAYHELAFYENKYLSVSLGVCCNVVALWAACRALRQPRPRAWLGAGAAAGLAALGRPNLIVAAPFSALAGVLARRGEHQRAAPVVALFALGVLLALAPMALRNQIAIGRPDVFPSHSGGIPFFIGNNPAANGRWNTAGDLLSGQVGRERIELAAHLGIRAQDPAELDRAVGAAMRERALRFIREQPFSWLGLELRKLWLTLGNHRFVRDYDVRGEAELIGAWHAWGLPFGVLLALGVLGLGVLLRRARETRAERALLVGVVLVLGGQLCAVLAANLLVFTSAQNRLPLCVPLAFAAGPGLLALHARLRRRERSAWQVSVPVMVVAAVLLLQAFVPRSPRSDRPTSVHYYNLAAVEDAIGRLDAAAEHYGRAAERNPKQPMFHFSQARALRRLGRGPEAEAALRRLEALSAISDALRDAVSEERRLLRAGDRR